MAPAGETYLLTLILNHFQINSIALKNCNSFHILFDLVSSVVILENQYKITNFM